MAGSAGLGINGLLQYFTGMTPLVGRSFEHQSNKLFQNNLPDINTICALKTMGYISEETMIEAGNMLGFDNDTIRALDMASQQRLQPLDYITLWRRGGISWEMLFFKLKELRLPEEDINLLIKSSEYFPTAQDLVRFAVREVYTPQTVAKFGQLEDLPQEFLDEALKAGLQEDQAKNYWASHWELPGANAGYEMLHRTTNNKIDDDADEIVLPSGKVCYNVIGKKTLQLLLKSLDITPFWRDKLTAISYNPLTRVDVRRMYGLGVLDKDGVYRNYLDQGYDQENAKLMTEFTIRYENPELDGISRATVISGYQDNLITIEELEQYLKMMNYTDSVVTFWLQQAEYDKMLKELKSTTDDLAQLYQMGAISIEEVESILLTMDVPATYVKQVTDTQVKQKAKRTKVPSKEDLTGWLNKQIIDEEYYTMKMRAIGYRDEDIQNYLTEINFVVDTSKRKYLSIETYLRWVKSGIMEAKDFYSTLEDQGVAEKDIQYYKAQLGV